MRLALRIVIVLALAYAAIVAGLAFAMRQPPATFGVIMARMPPIAFIMLPFERLWMNARAGSLELDQDAPDFALQTLDHSSTVRLSSLRGKSPVVLVFGSYT
jgi:hypothetical protein